MRRWLLPTMVGILVSCGPIGTPLRLERHDQVMRVRVEFLGEYPSDIALIELTHAESGQGVWRVEPAGESFELYNLDLRPGRNPARLAARGNTRTVLPQSDHFVLKSRTPYQVRVCAHGWYKRCAKKVLALPASPSNSTSAADANPRHLTRSLLLCRVRVYAPERQAVKRLKILHAVDRRRLRPTVVARQSCPRHSGRSGESGSWDRHDHSRS
jgi:hypothetical protein